LAPGRHGGAVIPGPAPERQKGARPAERTPYVPGLAATRTPVRGTAQRFVPQLFGAHVTRTNALEALAISGGVRLRCYVVGATGIEPVTLPCQGLLGRCENLRRGRIAPLNSAGD
jgi:hypothetical protein